MGTVLSLAFKANYKTRMRGLFSYNKQMMRTDKVSQKP